ncbi:glycosyltransferase family 4 protein [Candidatus Saccharibacteria bacterium]|nr:glycosyltransferase family 4 protein [Candidatus Saccharibacteria bacterium]
MKTIVIDTRKIDSSTGFYMQHLLRQLNDRYANEFRFVALVPSLTREQWAKQFPHITIAEADEASYSLAEQTSFVARLESHHPDLVHFTMPQQPFLWVKPAVTTIHDLTLVRYDNIDMNKLLYKVRKGVFISLLRTVIMRSRAIITPTHYVRDDLIDYAGKRFAPKIHVTHEAGDPVRSEPEVIPQIADKQFIFYVGNAFPYKNVQHVIDGFVQLRRDYRDLQLVLAGKKDAFYKEHEQYVRSRRIRGVHFLGFISPGEKRWALQHCVAYVTASLSEGFNITLLEAMYEGAPAVISDATCHREVAGTAALFFDPASTSDLVTTVSSLIDDPSLRQKMIKKGTARVKEFSWARMADETVAVYRTVLKN